MAYFDDSDPREQLRTLGIAGKYGLAGLLGGTYDTLAFAGNTPTYLGNIFREKPLDAPFPYASPKIVQGIDYLTGDILQPQNDTQKVVGSIGEFLGAGRGMAGNAATKASPFAMKYLAPQGAKDYLALASAGAGSELARQYDPESTFLPLVAGMGAAAVPGAAMGTAKAITSPKEIMAKLFEVNPNKVDAFKEAGLNPTLSNASDSRRIGTAENLLREVPWAGSPIQKIIKENIDKINSFDKGLGREEAGKLGQFGAQAWTNKGSNIAGKLKSRVDSHITEGDKVKVNNVLDLVSKKPKFDSPEAHHQYQQSPTGQEYEKLANVANRNGGAISTNDLFLFRDGISDKISTFGLMGDKQQGNLKNLRNVISDDLKTFFHDKGPEAARDYERYNKFYTQYRNKYDETISEIVKNPSATAAFSSIVNNLKVDAQQAKSALSTLKPDQKKLFSESLVRELGSNPQNEFTPSSLAKNFKKLDPNAQEVILSPYTPPEAKKFKANIEAINAIGETVDLANKSRTAITQTLVDIAKTGGKIAGSAIGLSTFPFATTLTYASSIGASYGLFANPKFVNWLGSAKSIRTPKQFEQHINGLQRIAKTTPILANDIAGYLETFDKVVSGEQPEATTIDMSHDEALKKYNELYKAAPQDSAEPELDIHPDEALRLYHELYYNRGQ